MTLSTELVKLISNDNRFICLTGGGGKTSLMQLIAKQYKQLGKSVLMTTTTKVQSPDVYKWDADRIITDKNTALSFTPSEPCVVLYAETFENREKLTSPDLDTLEIIKDRYDVVLCEADGSRQMPVKWHTDRDPVVPGFCTYTVSVFGAWGQCDSWDDYVNDTQGLLKGTIPGKRAVLINGCENIENEKAIMFLNIQWPSDCVILEASVQNNEIYRIR